MSCICGQRLPRLWYVGHGAQLFVAETDLWLVYIPIRLAQHRAVDSRGDQEHGWWVNPVFLGELYPQLRPAGFTYTQRGLW